MDRIQKTLEILHADSADVPSGAACVLEEMKVPWQFIDVLNWPAFPFRPDVFFRAAYTDRSVLLQYRVLEPVIRACCRENNGPVWKDSCVEFFFMPEEESIYYNFEFSCTGKILLAAGQDRFNRVYASEQIISGIQLYSSAGSSPFEEKPSSGEWILTAVIPFASFFKSRITDLSGKTGRANFYKCGDYSSGSHYLSWNPVLSEKPDFHRPESFGVLKFI